MARILYEFRMVNSEGTSSTFHQTLRDQDGEVHQENRPPPGLYIGLLDKSSYF